MTDQPASSSKETTTRELLANEDEDITLNIQNDEAEILRLELPPGESDTVKDEEDDDRIAKIRFDCTECGMAEMVHYFGKTPPFVYGISMIDDTYVMRDPFQPGPGRGKRKAEYFVALGAHCLKCKRSICKDAECSFFYTATFCLRCARSNMQSFPLEAQNKLRKQLAAT